MWRASKYRPPFARLRAEAVIRINGDDTGVILTTMLEHC